LAATKENLKDIFYKAKHNYLNIVKKAEAEEANHFDEELEAQGNLSRIKVKGKDYISFTTNDYLGLSNNPRVKAACIEAVKKYGNGTCGARVAGGTTPLHKRFEKQIAKFTREESAALFNTGYMANLAIADILGEDDAIITDKLSHASIFDGIRLCGAKLFRFKHNDLQSLEDQIKKSNHIKRRIIFVESVYSMDGDIAPLPEIIKLAQKHEIGLVVDEAHAIGTLGKTGRGILEYFNIGNENVDIRMGTLSKSAGAVGGFVVGTRLTVEIIRYNSRQYIFSASLPTSVVAGALEAFKIMEEDPSIIAGLQKKYTTFSGRLREYGFNLGNSCTQIIPIIIGDETKTCLAHNILLGKGIYVTSVIYPVVPQGEARLRVGITANHTEEDLEKLFWALDYANHKLGLIK